MENDIVSCGIALGVFLVFLILKLLKVIAWSWWWITVPLWGSLILILTIMLITVIVIGIIELIRAQED